MSKHIIIMAKPPLLGKVKTRLANSVGEPKALELYTLMMEKTFEMVEKLNLPTTVFFTEKNHFTDKFNLFNKDFQCEGDLGKKMKTAFEIILEKGFQKIVMIGTDCPDNSTSNITDAFDALNQNDVVFGPSDDGGYYLIGMSKLYSELFTNKIWSTSLVYQEALEEVSLLKIKSKEVATINDIDTYEDLKKSKFYNFVKTIH